MKTNHLNLHKPWTLNNLPFNESFIFRLIKRFQCGMDFAKWWQSTCRVSYKRGYPILFVMKVVLSNSNWYYKHLPRTTPLFITYTTFTTTTDNRHIRQSQTWASSKPHQVEVGFSLARTSITLPTQHLPQKLIWTSPLHLPKPLQ